MGIDPAAVLALLSDLTNRLARLQQENEQLRQALAAATTEPAPNA